MLGQPCTGVFDERFARGSAQLPKFGIGNGSGYLSPSFPSVPSHLSFPQAFVQSSSPAAAESQVGMWTPLVTYPTGTSSSGQRGKKRFEKPTADFPVQPAYSVHRSASPDGKISHVETLRRVIRILAAQGHQVLKGYAKLLLRIPFQILLDQGRRETVKAGGDRRVSGVKRFSRAGGGQSRPSKGCPVSRMKVEARLQNGERGVSFVEMTDFRPDAERTEQPPAAYPQQHFLFEAKLRAAAVEFTGNSTGEPGNSRHHYYRADKASLVPPIKLHSSHLNLPGAKPDGIAGNAIPAAAIRHSDGAEV